MSEVYEYSMSGRRPVVWGALGVTVLLLILAARHDAPLAIWVIWGAVAAALCWSLTTNPVNSLSITDEDLSWRAGGRMGHFPLNHITDITITEWSDGGPDCRITLITGETVDIPGICLPSAATLKAQLAARGLPVNGP